MGLGAIVLVASALRLAGLGRESLWYDEVVSMTVARRPMPGVLPLLTRLDATAAPLHPLFLHAWLRAFGPSEASGRSLSAIFGVLTVLGTFAIGRRLYGTASGLWAGWLAAVSPLLVQYSREARMYACLGGLTVLAWWLLILFERSRAPWLRLAYALSLSALAFAHPLGLLMVAALGLASLIHRHRLGLTVANWVSWHALAGLLFVPWLQNYLDHDPSIASERWLGLRYLLGLPIGFVGGNFAVLAGCLGLIAWGSLRFRRDRPRVVVDDGFALSILSTWLIVPPALLYAFSVVSHPIFGQARYTLFVGPAYLILLGHGLARLPRPAAWGLAAALAACSAMLLGQTAYAPGLKADWRSGARVIRGDDPGGATVVVYSEDPRWSREVEVARYYLGPGYEVVPAAEADLASLTGPVWLAAGVRQGRPVADLPTRASAMADLDGLRLVRFRGPGSP